MKIAFVSDAAYPWNIGGIENLIHAEAKGLAERYDVHFFSMRWPGMKKDFKKENINYHTDRKISTKTFYRHGRRSIREAVFFSLGLLKIFRYRFDLIVSNQFPVLQLPILEIYCKLTGCKLVLEVAEVWSEKYWTEYLGGVWGRLAHIYASTFMKFADFYIVTSTATERDLLSIVRVDKHKVRVFAPVLDDDQIRAKNNTSKKNKIVFFGRLIKEKRMDKWLKIVNKVAKKVNVTASIYGEGPEKSNIKSMVDDLKLKDVVRVNDFAKSKEFVYNEMAQSSLFLQMSEREGLSIIVLESIAMGTPVVLPTYSPIPEEVKKMCVVLDESHIADKVVDIIKSKDKSEYIRNKEGIKYFSKSHVNDFFLDVFKDLDIL